MLAILTLPGRPDICEDKAARGRDCPKSDQHMQQDTIQLSDPLNTMNKTVVLQFHFDEQSRLKCIFCWAPQARLKRKVAFS